MFTFHIDKVEVHAHVNNTEVLKEIAELKTLIIKNHHEIMSLTQKDFNEMVSRLDAVSNDIAADYKKLLDEIEAGKITDESVAAAKANIEKLEALGASVDNPVPEPTV